MAIHLKTFESKEVIFEEGTLGRTLYEVEAGAVGVFKDYGTPNEYQLALLGQGEIFGEMAMLEGEPRNGTVVSMKDGTRVREVATDTVYDFIKREPNTVLKMMRNLSGRLRRMTQAYEEASRQIAQKAGVQPKEEISSSGSRIEVYRRGQIIFREGEAGDCMYFLDDGRVGIFTSYGTDEQRMIVELDEASFFGEMGMIEKMPRSATAVALEDGTKLERIEESNLKEMIDKAPGMTYVALQHLSSRLRDMTQEALKAQKVLEGMK